MKKYFCKDTLIGKLTICEEEEMLLTIKFGDVPTEDGERALTGFISKVFEELEEYFQGKRKEFDIPILLYGTEFQKKVWEQLMKIPYGKVVTYKDIARLAGSPKAYRAVGLSNNRNPIPIIIPCHRVIGADGRLVGYAGGLNIKRQLLHIEGVDIEIQ